jgi:hypothetical protein
VRSAARVGQPLRFRTAIAVTGLSYEPPYRVRLEVDGEEAGSLKAPPPTALQDGQLPFSFTHRFHTPGVHLISVILEPDPPPEARGRGTRLRDHLPGDNRQDLAVEVVASLPVLLVDGDATVSAESSTHFLRKALAASSDPSDTPAVLSRAVPVRDFAPVHLTEPLDPTRPDSRPRVLVLADVPHLTEAQRQAVEQFLAEGGGVLVAPAARAEGSADFYNRELYRDGNGWLPARLEAIAGDRARPELASAPDVKRLQHSALELFRDEPSGTLGRARFPRWWKVRAGGSPPGVIAGLLTSDDPMLVERSYKKGKVLLCAVPLDRSWGGTLPGVWEFPILIHELVSYLARSRSADYNVRPGQPLHYRPAADGAELPPSVLLVPPDGVPRPIPVDRWPVVYEEARATGVYKFVPEGGQPAYFVVPPDPGESDLTPCTADDRQKVAGLVALRYEDDSQALAEALAGPAEAQDLWWLALVGVLLLLCGEILLTRRLSAGREAAG